MIKKLFFIFFCALSISSNAQCYTDIAFGGAHTTARKADGTLWGWGFGAWGELLTTNETEPLPVQLGTATDWNYITNGVVNTFVIKNNGTLWGCGSNQLGSLGVNSNTQSFASFQQITTAEDWVKVSASYFFTLALKADGTIWAWGQNDLYQLGNPPATAQQLFPIQVGTASDWADIASGTSDTAFAIKSNGTIWGWGANPSSIIVPGSSTQSVTTPTQVGTDTDWAKMSVGGAHILAQKTDGTLWSWGGGSALGVGGTPSVTNIPQQISADLWKSFSAGTGTSFGVKADGTLWAWGVNINGQLADGTSVNRTIPTQIGTDTNWSTVKAGKFSPAVATKTDGSVWYWGLNYYGEFGNGSSYGTSYYSSPQQTAGVCVNSLALPDFGKEASFAIYPNPAKDGVTVRYDSGTANAQIAVFDMAGRNVGRNVQLSPDGEIQIDTSNYAAGMYMVVVRQDGLRVAQKKLVIE